LNIPILPGLDYGKFYLMPFTHSLTDEATVSRFFQQTTFGPTLDMINSWDYESNIETAMASWIESQIDATPATYHREYFRARVRGPLRYNSDVSNIVGPYHPCDQGSS
jgi:hypothetical protein